MAAEGEHGLEGGGTAGRKKVVDLTTLMSLGFTTTKRPTPASAAAAVTMDVGAGAGVSSSEVELVPSPSKRRRSGNGIASSSSEVEIVPSPSELAAARKTESGERWRQCQHQCGPRQGKWKILREHRLLRRDSGDRRGHFSESSGFFLVASGFAGPGATSALWTTAWTSSSPRGEQREPHQ